MIVLRRIFDMRISCLALIMVIFMSTSCSAEPKIITGTVVDAESGAPVEGAVVLVEWTKAEGMPGLTSTKSYKVVEAVTDKEGKFTVEDMKKILIDPPDVAIYKKSYVCWSSRIIFPDWRNRTDFKWGKTTLFKLEHFKSEYSYIKHTSFIGSAINSGLSEKKLINEAYYWEELEASKERNKINEKYK